MEPEVGNGESTGAEQEASSDEADESDPEPQPPSKGKAPLRQRNPP